MALFAKGILVVVADGEKAMILVNEGTPAAPRLVLREKVEQVIRRAQDMVTDKPGRMPDPGAGFAQRSAMEQPDPVREAKESFAEALAERLNAMDLDGVKIVLAAPPGLLSVLRETLDPAVRAQVLVELPKTLTQHPLQKMGQVIAADLDEV